MKASNQLQGLQKMLTGGFPDQSPGIVRTRGFNRRCVDYLRRPADHWGQVV